MNMTIKKTAAVYLSLRIFILSSDNKVYPDFSIAHNIEAFKMCHYSVTRDKFVTRCYYIKHEKLLLYSSERA